MSSVIFEVDSVTGAPFNSIIVEPAVDASVNVDVGLVTLIPVPPLNVASIFASPPDPPCNKAVLMFTFLPFETD